MSVEKLNDELEFAASQGPDVAVMTTQETVRAVLAEVGMIYVTAHGDHITGERAVDLYDCELERCRRTSSELADCKQSLTAERERSRVLREALTQAREELRQQKLDMHAMPFVSNPKELAAADEVKAQQAINKIDAALAATEGKM